MKKAFKTFSIMLVIEIVLPSAKIGALALWDSWCGRLVRFRRSHTILKTNEVC